MSWIYLLNRRTLSRVEELSRRDRHHSVFESRTFRGFFNRLVVSRIEETVFVPFLKLNVVLDQLFRIMSNCGEIRWRTSLTLATAGSSCMVCLLSKKFERRGECWGE